jgi:hypothetical protein
MKRPLSKSLAQAESDRNGREAAERERQVLARRGISALGDRNVEADVSVGVAAALSWP